jgi:hypothetical protein
MKMKRRALIKVNIKSYIIWVFSLLGSGFNLGRIMAKIANLGKQKVCVSLDL